MLRLVIALAMLRPSISAIVWRRLARDSLGLQAIHHVQVGVHLKLAGLPAPPLAHILGDLREQHIHVDAPIHLALDGAAEGVRSLFQKYRLKLINYWHVKRVDLDLQQAHLSLHLIYSGFSLFEPLRADDVLGLTPRILG